MKNTRQTGDSNTNDGESQDQGNESNSGSQGFLGGITDAIGDIFNRGNDDARTASQDRPKGGIPGMVSDISETVNNASRTSADRTTGGIPGAVSGVSETVESATRTASGQTTSPASSSGTWPDFTDQSAAGSAIGGGVAQGSIDPAGTDMGADGGGSGEDEPFVGSGGVGSPEFYENLRRAHESAGDDYASDLSDPNKA